MTRGQLEGLRAMDRIIEQDKEQLRRMREVLEHPGHAELTGMPGGFREGDKIGEAIGRMEELEARIRGEILVYEKERAEIYEFCMSIPDNWIRSLVVWRNVNLYSWRKVASKAHTSEQSVKMAYARWCKKTLE